MWFTRLLTDQPVVARVYGGGSTTRVGKVGSEVLAAEAVDAISDPATGPALVVWSRGPHEPLGDVLPSPLPYSVVSSVDHEIARRRRCGTVDAEYAAYWRLTYRVDMEHTLAGLAPLIGAARASGATVIFTAVRSSGIVAGGKFSVTSLATDTGGDFACLQLVSTDGGGTTPTHSGLYCASPLDALIKVSADGMGGVVVGSTMTISPEATAESGYIKMAIGATIYQIPIYAA